MTRLVLLRSRRPWGYLAVATAMVVFVLVQRDAPWRGEWAWTFDWVAGASTLLGPLLAGMTAFETAEGRPFDRELARPTATRRWVAVLAPAAGPVAAVLVAYLGAVVGGVAASATFHPTDAVEPVMPLLGALVLLVWAGLGALVGLALPPGPAAIVAWLGGVALTVGTSVVGLPRLFRVGASTGTLAGLDVHWPGVVAYLAAYVAIVAVVGLCLRGVRGWRRYAGVFGGLGLVLATTVWATHDDRLYAAADAPQWRCTTAGAAPQVCLLAGNTTQLAAWGRGVGQLVDWMDRAGMDPERAYRQPPTSSRAMTPGAGVVLVDPTRVNLDPPTLAQLADTVARPSDCPGFRSEAPPVGALDAQHWLAELIATSARPASRPDRDPEVLAWMARTPPAVQAQWARATYERLRACSLTALAVPADG